MIKLQEAPYSPRLARLHNEVGATEFFAKLDGETLPGPLRRDFRNFRDCPLFASAGNITAVNELTDRELLRAYADGGSESAFAELVSRHVPLVYSFARRVVVDTH